MVPRTSFFAVLPCLLAAPFSTRAAGPEKPTNFLLTWAPSGLINCSWKDKSSNETGFVVAYRTSPTAQFEGYAEVAANVVTYSDTPTNWPGCSNFEWTVFAFKGPDTAREYSDASNVVSIVAPPRLKTAFATGVTGQAFSFALTTDCNNPAFTTDTLPAGLTFNPATKTITGTPTNIVRGFPFNVAITSGTVTSTQTAKITIFRPVPALVAPVNGTPLIDRTLRKDGTPLQVDLSAHFSDPDVTQASRIVFNTGTMDFVYYPSAAPASVTNFLGYISRGDYTNSIIHRSITGFVLQGGGYKAGAGATSVPRQPAVVNEPEISNTRGTVAMAKLGTDPNSATSEYFISLADNSQNLNNQNEGFTVFARVAGNGMTVADSIAGLTRKNFSTTNSALTDCPVTDPPPAAYDVASLVKVVSAAPVNPLAFTAQSSAPAVCEATVAGTQLTLTSHAPGTAVISVTATDLDNQPLASIFNVTVNEVLADWLTAQNFPVPADALALSNPDGDAAVNIMEYALMTNPQSPSPVPLPQSGVTTVGASNYLTLTFPVRKYTSDAFAYAVEAGNGLEGGWTPVWTSAQGFAHAQVVSSTVQPDRTNVTIRDTAAITAGGKRFLRLRVTDTPQ